MTIVWNEIRNVYSDITKWLDKITKYTNDFSQDPTADFIKAEHFEKRIGNRKITMVQVLHVLGHGKAVGLERSTQPEWYKVKIKGKDFDENVIVIVVVPSKNGFKGITTYYDEKRGV